MHGLELRQARPDELQYFSILAPVSVSCTQGCSQIWKSCQIQQQVRIIYDSSLACQGTADELQILAGPYKQMCVDGKTLEIPLIGQHSSNAKVKRVQGAKKIRKLLREHGQFGQIGYIWKIEEKINSDDSQDEDAQKGLLGVDKLREVINAGGSCASQQTTSTQKTKMAKCRARDIAAQEQIDKDKQHIAYSSARIKAQLRAEFPQLFETRDHLQPLRWENHRVDLETGARYPPVRGLPRMSKAEMDETQVFLTDMLKRGWIEPSLASYGAPFFLVPKPNGRGLQAVCNFRAVNSITKKDLPSFPLFENIVTQLEGAKFFNGLDLTFQFYQILVEPTDVPKTSFLCQERTCQRIPAQKYRCQTSCILKRQVHVSSTSITHRWVRIHVCL